jgi:hypothetical protein
MILEPADRAEDVRGGDGFGNVVEAQPVRGKPRWVHQDLEFFVLSASDANLGDAGDPSQHRPQLE